MPFIHTFGGAMKLLHSIEIGTCTGSCRSSWIRNFKYALKTETNPLKLTPTQRKQLTAKINSLSGKKIPKKT